MTLLTFSFKIDTEKDPELAEWLQDQRDNRSAEIRQTLRRGRDLPPRDEGPQWGPSLPFDPNPLIDTFFARLAESHKQAASIIGEAVASRLSNLSIPIYTNEAPPQPVDHAKELLNEIMGGLDDFAAQTAPPAKRGKAVA